LAKKIKRKKTSRHELKEDRFLETTKNFITFFRENSSRIILVVVIIAIAGIALRVYFANKKSSEEQARLKKLYADALYEQGKFKEAVAAYQDIINVYGATKTGRISTLFLANSYFFAGDVDNALDYYEQSLKKLKGNKNLASAAQVGIASVYEQKGQFQEAIDNYEKAIEEYENTPSRIEALFAKARCLEFTNRYEEAVEVYSKIVGDYPESNFAEDAEKRIIFLRGAAESERIRSTP
jgi:tetratricopeptide (TPR) repeat protein